MVLLGLFQVRGIAAETRPLIFAAASTTGPMTAAIQTYERMTGRSLAVSFASSSILAQQIAAGAPAGIFLSANLQWADYLETNGFLGPRSKTAFMSNSLVVISSGFDGGAPSPVSVKSLPDLVGDGRLVVADPDHVPAGMYAKQALEYYGIWESLRGRLVRQPDVSSALAMVERGEVQYGIVYFTDSLRLETVDVVSEISKDAHSPITYSVSLVGHKPSSEMEGFYRFLLSDAGRSIFERFGFIKFQR